MSERGNGVRRQSLPEDTVNDIGDPADWELVAASEEGDVITLEYCISFTPEESRLIARAGQVGHLDVFAVAKRAVLEKARAMLKPAVAAS